jgi:hypothetical protein
MSKYTEYSRAAEECSKMSDSALSENERRAWLKLAESWLRLARTLATEPDRERQFETAVKQRGTGQNPSARRH